MKSFQVELNHPHNQAEQARYSDLQVLKSAAGWYIGTIYTAPEGWQEPGSRDTDYYRTKEDAQYALTYLENLERICRDELPIEDIIQKWAKQMLTMGKDPRRVGYRYTP